MKIMSYVDVKKKSLRILSQLNTYGCLISFGDTPLHKELVLYNQTPYICKWDTHHVNPEELSHYKTVELV